MYEHSRFITPRLIWFTALHIVLFFAMILFYHSVLCCSTQSVLLFYSICLCTPSWNSTLLNYARCFHQWATTPIGNTRVTLSRRASLQACIFHHAEKLGVALCSWPTANPHHYMRFFFLMIYSTKSVICSLKITHLDMNIFRTSQPGDVNATPRYSCYIRFASLDISCIIFFLI